jgi:excisionase family DNA binding protein
VFLGTLTSMRFPTRMELVARLVELVRAVLLRHRSHDSRKMPSTGSFGAVKYAEHVKLSGVLRMPLPRSDEGLARTVRLIRDLMDAAVADHQVNEAAITILRNAGAQNFDRQVKLRALYDFVSWPNFLYVEDPVGPFGPKETVRTVRTLLRVRAGDCDDFTLLLASLAGTIGIATRAVTVAADLAAPDDFSHIYPEAEVSPGNWVALDATRPGTQFGLPAQRYFRKRVWSLTDPSCRDVAGQRVSSEEWLLTVREAAKYLAISPSTLYGWVWQRRIAFVKVGRALRFDLADLQEFIRANRVQARPSRKSLGN